MCQTQYLNFGKSVVNKNCICCSPIYWLSINQKRFGHLVAPWLKNTTYAIFIQNRLSKVEILSLTHIGKWLFLAKWLTISQLFYDNFEHIHQDYNMAEINKNPTKTSRDIKVGTSQNIAQCGQPLAIF